MIATALATIALVLPAAQAPWQDSRCTGHEQITVVAASSMGTNPAGDEIIEGRAIVADAECRVWIRAGLTKAEICTTLTHELGHLAGMGHSANPSSIMYPTPRTPPRCRRYDRTRTVVTEKWVSSGHRYFDSGRDHKVPRRVGKPRA